MNFRLALVGVMALSSITTAQQSLRCWGASVFDTAVDFGPPIQISAQNGMLLVLRADGRAFARGRHSLGNGIVPNPPAGLRFVHVSAGYVCVGILSDGSLAQWGQINLSSSWPLPTLPAGTVAISAESGPSHNVALLSNGSVLAWGENGYGECNVPTWAPGITCVQVSAGGTATLALLSDGTISAWGNAFYGLLSVPPLPAGRTYTKVDGGYLHALALRDDGELVGWGTNTNTNALNIPALPSGVVYVDFWALLTFVWVPEGNELGRAAA